MSRRRSELGLLLIPLGLSTFACDAGRVRADAPSPPAETGAPSEAYVLTGSFRSVPPPFASRWGGERCLVERPLAEDVVVCEVYELHFAEDLDRWPGGERDAVRQYCGEGWSEGERALATGTRGSGWGGVDEGPMSVDVTGEPGTATQEVLIRAYFDDLIYERAVLCHFETGDQLACVWAEAYESLTFGAPGDVYRFKRFNPDEPTLLCDELLERSLLTPLDAADSEAP